MTEFYKGKKVLVTGATGLVGSRLCERLVELGATVVATHHQRKKPDIENVLWIFADLTKRHDISIALRPWGYTGSTVDLVFHCAASTSGAATMSATPLVHVTPNILMNAQLFEECYNKKIQKVMYLSSTTGYPVFDGPITEDKMFEGDPYEKYFPVGWMKRYSEKLCQLYSERLNPRMPCLVLRPSNLIGPRDKFDPDKSHVLPALIRKVCSGMDPIEVWGDGNEIRDFLYCDDMVDAMLLAMEKQDTYDPLNIGMGQTYSVKDILGIILDLEGKAGVGVKFDLSKPTMIPKREIDCSKSEKVLGWKAKTGIREAIEKTIQWYKVNYHG